MSKLPIYELFISGGNLEPKLEWFFKPKLKAIFFLLNCHPGRLREVLRAPRQAPDPQRDTLGRRNARLCRAQASIHAGVPDDQWRICYRVARF